MMLVTKALPQDVAFLAFVPSLRRHAIPAGSFACSERRSRQLQSPSIPINFIEYPFLKIFTHVPAYSLNQNINHQTSCLLINLQMRY